MSDRIYEWTLTSKKGYLIRQGVVCSKTKKDAESYLRRSFSEDEKEIEISNILTIRLLGGNK